MSRIYSPFNRQAFELFNEWQNGLMHPYTCINGHGKLEITVTGLTCTQCDYVQNWFHEFLMEDK